MMQIYLTAYAIFLAAFGFYTLFMSIANIIHFRNIEKKAELHEDGELVSVVIPARNEENNLPRLMDSLLKQSYRNMEILVIDDASTDRTWEILQGYAAKDPRVRIFQSDPAVKKARNGKINALLQLIVHAKGEYLYATDADTEHGRDAVSFAYSVMKDRNLDIVSGFPKEKCESYLGSVNMSAMILTLTCIPHFLARFFSIPAFSVAIGQFIMMKKSSYDEVGGYDSIKDRTCDDMSISNRFVKLGKKYHFIPVADHISCNMYAERKQAFNGIARSVNGAVPMSFAAIPIVALILILFFHIVAAPLFSICYPLWGAYFLQMELITFGWVAFYAAWYIACTECRLDAKVALSCPIAIFQTAMMYIYGLNIKLRGKNFIWKGRQI